MFANDLKKGMRVVMKGTNWDAIIMDNKKGLIRMCEVEGIEKEIGSVYVYNIAKVLNPATNQWERVELTEDQKKKAQTIKSFGF